LDKALDAFQKCIELDVNYPTAFNNIGSVYLSRYLNTAEAEALRQAQENFKKAVTLDPRYASAYNGLGGTYLKTGNIDGAITCLEKAVELEPNYSLSLYNLGLAYLQKGDLRKALEALNRYRDKNYHLLPTKDKSALDALIEKIQKSLSPSGE
jgi:Flp pilus assembly protein TadD